MQQRTSIASTCKFITDLFKTHSPDLIIKVIDDGYRLGYTNTKILESLQNQFSVNIRPVHMRTIIEAWYPETYHMTIAKRRNWLYATWPLYKIEVKQWTKLHDPTHPVFKHFTTTNITNFYAQRAQAQKRGVGFKLDFISWIVWWLSTGHFDERGVYNHSYQMCRKGDTGDYEWDNIYCDTGENNKSSYHQINKIAKTAP